jgi:hypothetical protein
MMADSAAKAAGSAIRAVFSQKAVADFIAGFPPRWHNFHLNQFG